MTAKNKPEEKQSLPARTPSRGISCFDFGQVKPPMMLLRLFLALCGINMLLSRSSAFILQVSRSSRGRKSGMTSRFLSQEQRNSSVSGIVYSAEAEGAPKVRLFTKKGCTLCDKVKGVLQTVHGVIPHSLESVDITDEDNIEWFKRYKYDIPVLHVGDKYWIKHRLTEEEAIQGLKEARDGTFQARQGEPNAGEMERRQANGVQRSQ
jgi:glutaredoxin